MLSQPSSDGGKGLQSSRQRAQQVVLGSPPHHRSSSVFDVQRNFQKDLKAFCIRETRCLDLELSDEDEEPDELGPEALEKRVGVDIDEGGCVIAADFGPDGDSAARKRAMQALLQVVEKKKLRSRNFFDAYPRLTEDFLFGNASSAMSRLHFRSGVFCTGEWSSAKTCSRAHEPHNLCPHSKGNICRGSRQLAEQSEHFALTISSSAKESFS